MSGIPEIARRYIGGQWKTGVAEDSGGGSQPWEVVRVPLAFDTPDLVLTGIDLYVPTPEDVVLWMLSYMTIPTAFDGTTPVLNLTYSDLADAYASYDLSTADPTEPTDGHTERPRIYLGGDLVWLSPLDRFPDATPLRGIVDDGAGGDPGSAAGQAELVLFIVPAAS